MTKPIPGPSAERLRQRELLRQSPVYLVTEESLSAGRRSEEIAQAALDAGVRVIQVREKDGSVHRALEVALNLRVLTRRYGALLIVNDRIDMAIACDADGVHLGQDDLPISLARRLLGEDALIGLSITSEAQLAQDDAAEADYLGVGAVFPTGSKGDAALTGPALLTAARTATDTPIVAIGGIDVANAGLAIGAGADSVAVISAITQAEDPGRAAQELSAAVRAATVGAAAAKDSRR